MVTVKSIKRKNGLNVEVFDVTFKDLSRGKLLVLKYLLEKHENVLVDELYRNYICGLYDNPETRMVSEWKSP